jgi:signal peptidase I
MEPTYSNYSIVNYTKLDKNTVITYTDVIYFEQNGVPIVKRIFAKSGDSIKCIEKLSVNGIETNASCSEKFEYSIKEGEYFVLGDNINQSTDSRVFGTIKEEQIIGVVK